MGVRVGADSVINCYSFSFADMLVQQVSLSALHMLQRGNTFKAPNFGPHGNFGPLFQKSLLSLRRVLQNNEENNSCRKTLNLQI
jgi:hypothetical protein